MREAATSRNDLYLQMLEPSSLSKVVSVVFATTSLIYVQNLLDLALLDPCLDSGAGDGPAEAGAGRAVQRAGGHPRAEHPLPRGLSGPIAGGEQVGDRGDNFE